MGLQLNGTHFANKTNEEIAGTLKNDTDFVDSMKKAIADGLSGDGLDVDKNQVSVTDVDVTDGDAGGSSSSGSGSGTTSGGSGSGTIDKKVEVDYRVDFGGGSSLWPHGTGLIIRGEKIPHDFHTFYGG